MSRLLLVLCLAASFLGLSWARDCPCSKPSLCNRVQHDGKEVHGIVLKSDQKVWNTFNWTKLTTISLEGFYEDKLLCLAHEHNVRVLKRETFSLKNVDNASFVNEWVQNKVKFAQQNFLDGINLFVDDPVPKGDILASKLTQFVQLVTQNFHGKIPGSIVVFEVPYSPYNDQKNGVDGKNYDFASISKVADQLFIRDFDQRKQSNDDRCLAGANSNYYFTLGGLLAYQGLNVSMDKLVLGVPFFAHDYQCLEYAENLKCYIEPKSYRGSKCSSDVATVVPLNQMASKYGHYSSTEFWDEHSSTVIYNYVSMPYGYLRQVWFDRGDTIALKFNLATQNHLRGIGMWTLNYMNNGTWKAIPNFKQHKAHH